MKWKRKEQAEDETIRDLVTMLYEHELSQIPKTDELKKRYRLSDSFYHTMEMMIAKQEKKGRIRNLRRSYTAAAAAAMTLLVLSQPQIIAAGKEWLVYWFQDHVSFQFAEEFAEETNINWVPPYKFRYVPEGFKLLIDDYSGVAGYLYYENEQGSRFDLDYGEISGGMNIDNENKDFTILTGIHGEKIYYLRSQNPGDESSMTWISQDGTTKLSLMSDLPEEELMKIQENICIDVDALKLYIKNKKFSKKR